MAVDSEKFVVSGFEILLEPLFPPPSHPRGGRDGLENPIVLQGYFLQLSLNQGSHVQVDLAFNETTGFKGAGSILMANYIDGDGNETPYTEEFIKNGYTFKGQKIYPGKTAIYGVQPIPPSSSAMNYGWRGFVTVTGLQPKQVLIAVPTQRIVYFKASDMTVIDSVVYPVPNARVVEV